MFRRQFWLWCLQRRRTGSPKSQVSRFFESHFRLLRRTRDTSHLELQFIALKISARTLGRALEIIVDSNLAEFINNDGIALAVRLRQDSVEQRSLSGTEIAGDYSDGSLVRSRQHGIVLC